MLRAGAMPLVQCCCICSMTLNSLPGVAQSTAVRAEQDSRYNYAPHLPCCTTGRTSSMPWSLAWEWPLQCDPHNQPARQRANRAHLRQLVAQHALESWARLQRLAGAWRLHHSDGLRHRRPWWQQGDHLQDNVSRCRAGAAGTAVTLWKKLCAMQCDSGMTKGGRAHSISQGTLPATTQSLL